MLKYPKQSTHFYHCLLEKIFVFVRLDIFLHKRIYFLTKNDAVPTFKEILSVQNQTSKLKWTRDFLLLNFLPILYCRILYQLFSALKINFNKFLTFLDVELLIMLCSDSNPTILLLL